MSLIQGCLSRTAATAADMDAARAEHQPVDGSRIDLDTRRALVRADEACRAAQLVVDRLHEVIDSLPRNRVDARDARFSATQAGYYLDDCLRALDAINQQIQEQTS